MTRRVRNVVATGAVAVLGVSFALGAVSSAAQAHGAATSAATTGVVVDPTDQLQTVEGWGTSLAWWAEASGQWNDASAPFTNPTERTTLENAIFDPAYGLGLNVVRYNFGGYSAGEKCNGTFRVGAATPTMEPAKGTWNYRADQGQVGVLQAAQDRGADVLEGTAYSAPWWMTKSQCSKGANEDGGNATVPTDNLDPANYSEYAAYLATLAKHFHDIGLPLRTVEPFNEPSISNWTNSNRAAAGDPPSYSGQEGMNVVGAADQASIIDDLHSQLSQVGTTSYTGISANDEENPGQDPPPSIPGAYQEIKQYPVATRNELAQYNAHGYGSGSISGQQFGALARANDRPSWMSEWGSKGSRVTSNPTEIASAIDLSQEINKKERQMQPSAWVAWQAADGPDNGGNIDDLWGLVWSNLQNGASKASCPAADMRATDDGLCYPPRYWVMGNYSKYVPAGSRQIATSDTGNNEFAAFDGAHNQLVVVATNPGTVAQSTSYDLSGFASVGSTAVTHQTTSTEHLVSGSAPLTGKALNVSLPPQSVTTYVIPATMGSSTAPTETDDPGIAYSSGTWNHCNGNCGTTPGIYNGTTSYSSQPGATATLNFTGTSVALYGVLDKNEGIGSIAVDGGPARDVDFFSKSRVGDRLVYHTDGLRPGPHTLVISVTGRYNPQSTKDLVALDRVEAWGSTVPAGSLVTGEQLGASRNNFTGKVGMQFTTGDKPIRLTALGRHFQSGNDNVHQLQLVRIPDQTVVASTQFDSATAPVDNQGFQYGTLGSAVTLAADTTYALVTVVNSGGDTWYDRNNTTVETTAGLTLDGSCYYSSTGAYTVTSAEPGHTYGPLSLKYSG